ncbi:hypothetical protein EVB55_208 [Rhizobium phage RHph_Y68]|uniref:Uncharacterized protein n=1 Tax=Rhizobium phage RHph_Y68 TaxID=2509787 RepID=A0A7S5QY61_9CAUD|nr:hypothetical protein PP934_gp208 [Rhizobium phage RHph_Y68]QIG68143.1 hypothetical protein EVB55_208 [Rhizobium phage RHph_Y68]
MTKNYRSNSYKTTDLDNFVVLGHFSSQIREITNYDFKAFTHAEYIEWIHAWQDSYAKVSACISSQKQNKVIGGYFPGPTSPERMAFASLLRKFANTLLNAREYAKNVRREVRKAEHDDLIADALQRNG